MRPSCLIQMCNIAFGFAGWHAKCSVMPFIEDVPSLPCSSSGWRTKARTPHVLRTRCMFLWLSLGTKTTWISSGCDLWCWVSHEMWAVDSWVEVMCVTHRSTPTFSPFGTFFLWNVGPHGLFSKTDASTNCVRFPYRWASVVDLADGRMRQNPCSQVPKRHGKPSQEQHVNARRLGIRWAHIMEMFGCPHTSGHGVYWSYIL